jgi:hypothetical protein
MVLQGGRSPTPTHGMNCAIDLGSILWCAYILQRFLFKVGKRGGMGGRGEGGKGKHVNAFFRIVLVVSAVEQGI